jgi:MraZ protein
MLRGSSPAKIDEKGRLKVPTSFRRVLEERYGPALFVTSILGDSARLYPLQVWEEIETKLLAQPSTSPELTAYLERVAYFGQQVEMDNQGRIVISPVLRESAGIQGEVVVNGHLDHLVVWNHERFLSRLEKFPLTEDKLRDLAGRGI